uniref:Reverse transcriptase Ty1/copia-type domain-containing protein n=1 Tax=Cannabis sativa TaxID=3483 RepID=A0A803NUD0_CANSA
MEKKSDESVELDTSGDTLHENIELNELDSSDECLDMRGNSDQQKTSDVELQDLLINIPNQSLVEDIPESSKRQLPHRLTRGIPKPTYEPELSSKMQSLKVCRLKKSLYGLKQSPRAWFGRFTKSMVAFGYHPCNSNHTLFLKKQDGKLTALIIYVDDMVVTGNDPVERKALQNYLSREFEMKDLGPLKYFLGIEVSRSKRGIFLSQRKYALDLLKEIGMSACQPINTPIEEGLKLRMEDDQVPVDKERYQRLVGRLMYLAHTRPDLAYALSIFSQFMHNPGKQHMDAVTRILRYLKLAPGKGILFSRKTEEQTIDVYTDADWAGDKNDMRSTSGYFTFVGGNLVSWRSKKQSVVARSSGEAEL